MTCYPRFHANSSWVRQAAWWNNLICRSNCDFPTSPRQSTCAVLYYCWRRRPSFCMIYCFPKPSISVRSSISLDCALPSCCFVSLTLLSYFLTWYGPNVQGEPCKIRSSWNVRVARKICSSALIIIDGYLQEEASLKPSYYQIPHTVFCNLGEE